MMIDIIIYPGTLHKDGIGDGLKDEASDRVVKIPAGPGFTAVVYGDL